MKRVGPKLTIEASCFGCSHEKSESYAVQGDSGHDVSCTYVTDEEKAAGITKDRRIGDTTWETPRWCPLLGAAKQRLLASMTSTPTAEKGGE